MLQAFLCALLLLAALGPILTFARLFQVKEWRWDRLREHLRHAGYLRQLFGWARPVFVAIGIAALLALPLLPKDWPITATAVLMGTWGLLAWFTLFRFVIGKQRCPVWTRKALCVLTFSLLLLITAGAALLSFADLTAILVLLLALPLLASAFVWVALLLLLPLDRLLKRRILERARSLRIRCPKLAVIGITGSVGKTTTKELLAHILRDRKILVTPAHVNTEMGVANLMLRELREEDEIFLVEMGAYRRGEIALLCALVHPHIGIITYVGDQHLALFGSREALCRAKGELFQALPPAGHAFLNADCTECANLPALAPCPVHTVGTGGHATYEAFDVQETPEGISFMLRDTAFRVPISGTHQVTNVVLAAAAAEVLGMPLAESAERLRSFAGLPQTFEKKEGKKGQVVLDDTHNASSSSFRAAIEWARTHPAQRKVLVAAGLIELGKEAEGPICQELGVHARDVFDDVVFFDRRSAQYFEQGYGKAVRVPRRKAFSLPTENGMLIVCEGRMPEAIVQRLLL